MDYLAVEKGWFSPYLFASGRRPVIPRSVKPDVVFCHGPFLQGTLFLERGDGTGELLLLLRPVVGTLVALPLYARSREQCPPTVTKAACYSRC